MNPSPIELFLQVSAVLAAVVLVLTLVVLVTPWIAILFDRYGDWVDRVTRK